MLERIAATTIITFTVMIMIMNMITMMTTNVAQWARITKNPDKSTGLLARLFARSLTPLTRSLAPDCSLRSRPPLRSLAHSLARGKVNFWCLKMTWFCHIVHSAAPTERKKRMRPRSNLFIGSQISNPPPKMERFKWKCGIFFFSFFFSNFTSRFSYTRALAVRKNRYRVRSLDF